MGCAHARTFLQQLHCLRALLLVCLGRTSSWCTRTKSYMRASASILYGLRYLIRPPGNKPHCRLCMSDPGQLEAPPTPPGQSAGMAWPSLSHYFQPLISAASDASTIKLHCSPCMQSGMMSCSWTCIPTLQHAVLLALNSIRQRSSI